MDTINILDKHKKVITKDKMAFYILANVLLLRRAKSEQLQDLVKLKSSRTLEIKLIELLKAGYLQQIDKEWMLTDFSTYLLENLGISYGVKNSLLNNLDISIEDKIFLSSYFEFINSEEEDSQDVINFLRTLNQTKSIWNRYLDKKKLNDFTKRSLYAFILNSNSNFQTIDSSFFVDELFTFHKINKTKSWIDHLSKLEGSKLVFLNSCNESITDYKLNNESYFNYTSLNNNIEDFNYYFTILRHCNVIFNDKPDAKLNYLFRFFPHFQSPLDKKGTNLYSELFSTLNKSIGTNEFASSLISSLITFLVSFYKVFLGGDIEAPEISKRKLPVSENLVEIESIKNIVYEQLKLKKDLNFEELAKEIKNLKGE